MKLSLETKIKRAEMAKRRNIIVFGVFLLFFLAAIAVRHCCPLEALTANMDPQTVGIIAISFNAFWAVKVMGISSMVLLVRIGFDFFDLQMLQKEKERESQNKNERV